MNVFRAWEDWTVFSRDFLTKLQNIFLGLTSQISKVPIDSNIDGVPLDTGSLDIDGLPFHDSEDVDGHPIETGEIITEDYGDHDVLPVTQLQQTSSVAKFKPSKWETVDPEVVEAQAMTTSKWEQLEGQSDSVTAGNDGEKEDEDVDGKPIDSCASPVPTVSSTSSKESVGGFGEDARGLHFLNQLHNELSEERRALLRELELKVLKFQDELESGKIIRKPGMSMEKQVEEYRRDLIRKEYSKSISNNGSDPGPSCRRKNRSPVLISNTRNRSPKSPKDSVSSPQRKKSRTKSPSRHSSPTHRSHTSSSHHRDHHNRHEGHSSSSSSASSSSSHRNRRSPRPPSSTSSSSSHRHHKR